MVRVWTFSDRLAFIDRYHLLSVDVLGIFPGIFSNRWALHRRSDQLRSPRCNCGTFPRKCIYPRNRLLPLPAIVLHLHGHDRRRRRVRARPRDSFLILWVLVGHRRVCGKLPHLWDSSADIFPLGIAQLHAGPGTPMAGCSTCLPWISLVGGLYISLAAAQP